MEYRYLIDEDGYIYGKTEDDLPDTIEIPEINPNEYSKYRFIDGVITRITEEEFRGRYPHYYDGAAPTLEEIQTEFNIDTDFRLSSLEIGTV